MMWEYEFVVIIHVKFYFFNLLIETVIAAEYGQFEISLINIMIC